MQRMAHSVLTTRPRGRLLVMSAMKALSANMQRMAHSVQTTHPGGRDDCHVCNESSFCQHAADGTFSADNPPRMKSDCHVCNESSFCQHAADGTFSADNPPRRKNDCHVCTESSFCRHEWDGIIRLRFKVRCLECSPDKICQRGAHCFFFFFGRPSGRLDGRDLQVSLPVKKRIFIRSFLMLAADHLNSLFGTYPNSFGKWCLGRA